MVEKLPDSSRLITIQVILPKFLYNFIMGYCKMANIKPEEFMFAAIMYSMDQLIEENKKNSLSYVG